eukprot:c4774_g1_i1 orf=94-258(-)
MLYLKFSICGARHSIGIKGASSFLLTQSLESDLHPNKAPFFFQEPIILAFKLKN